MYIREAYWSFSTVRVRWRNIQLEMKTGCELLLFMQHHRFSLHSSGVPNPHLVYLFDFHETEREIERQRIYSIFSLSLHEREI